MNDKLLAVPPDRQPSLIENSYESIKKAMDGATIDFVSNGRAGMFVNDNGMLEGDMLNVPASLLMARPLYGTVVLTAADPDDEGETLPPGVDDVNRLGGVAQLWQEIRIRARGLGQTIDVFSDPNFVPAPMFVELPKEWNFGDPIPIPACPECGSTDKDVKLPPCDEGANDWHDWI